MDASQNEWFELLKKYLDKEISPDELQELERQKAGSYLKQVQFEQFTNQKQFLELLSAQHSVNTKAGWGKPADALPLPQKKTVPFYKRKAIIWPAAACLLVIIGSYLFLWQPAAVYPYLQLANGTKINLQTTPDGWLPSTNNQQFFKKGCSLVMKNTPGQDWTENGYNVLYNPTSDNYNIELPDGSSIQLNAASSIKIPLFFSKKNRWVETSGETFFKVAKDNSSPFTVTTGKGTKIEVLGTSFNILAYTEEPEKITLLEGSIKLVNNIGSHSLKPGQQAVVDNKQHVEVSNLNRPRQAIAWTNDIFDFSNRDIPSSMLELGRHYHLKVYLNGTFRGKSLSGRISRSTPLAELLGILTKENGIHVEQINDQLIVTD